MINDEIDKTLVQSKPVYYITFGQKSNHSFVLNFYLKDSWIEAGCCMDSRFRGNDKMSGNDKVGGNDKVEG